MYVALSHAAICTGWREFLAERGTRPVAADVQAWYDLNASSAWGDNKPTWKEARVHAKCLRSTEQVC
jgi:hypothetical protein